MNVHLKKIIKILIPVIVITLLIANKLITVEDLTAIQLSLKTLIIAVSILISVPLLSTLRWYLLLPRVNQNKETFLLGLGSILIGTVSFGVVGTDGMRIGVLLKKGLAWKNALTVSFIDRVISFLSIFSLIVFLGNINGANSIYALLYLIFILSLLVFGTWKLQRKLLIPLFVLSIITFSIKIFAFLFLAELSLGYHQFIMSSIVMFSETLPISFNGFGVGQFVSKNVNLGATTYNNYFICKILANMIIGGLALFTYQFVKGKKT